MEQTISYIPLPVEDYIIHRLQGDSCGELHPDLKKDWENIKNLPHYPNNVDWAEVVAEWDGERYETNASVEMDRLREIVLRHYEQDEMGECVTCGAGAWVNPIGLCSDCQ